jgi:hypothetical protein
MSKEYNELLKQVAVLKLKEVLENGENSEQAFEEAMKALDRIAKIDEKEFLLERDEINNQFEMEKEEKRQEFEMSKEDNRQDFEMKKDQKDKEFQMKMEDKKESFELCRDNNNHQHKMEELKMVNKNHRKDRFIKLVEIGAVTILTPLLDAGCKKAFAEMLCEFEKDYNFTTMAGKSLSGLFKFKK